MATKQPPKRYDGEDVSPFRPIAAPYLMDGYSNATAHLRGSREEMLQEFPAQGKPWHPQQIAKARLASH